MQTPAMESALSAQALRLTDLPEEILLLVVEQVQDLPDLRSLARTSQQFYRFATPLIYRSVSITRGATAQSLANALYSHPDHSQMIQELLVTCPFDRWRGLEEFQYFFPAFSKLQHLRVETPDCNRRSHGERTHWRRIQDTYEDIFQRCSQPTAPLLPCLRSATIHFVDHTESRYSLDQYIGLLLHPTLETLSLSCAWLPATLASILEGKFGTTALKSLTLEQCDFNQTGLAAVLKLPKQLETLHLSENFNEPARDRTPKPSQYVACLNNLAHSLKELTLLFATSDNTHIPVVGRPHFDLSNLRKLKSLQFGFIPFYAYLEDHELQASYYNTSLGRLDMVNFPPKLESFTFSMITTHDFERNLEAVKSMTKANLRNIQINLPLNSHNCLTSELLEQLARPTLELLQCDVRFRVYDCDQRHAYIPPYLHGESPPREWLIIDNERISEFHALQNANAPMESGKQKQDGSREEVSVSDAEKCRAAITLDGWIAVNHKRNASNRTRANAMPNGFLVTPNGQVQLIFNEFDAFGGGDMDDGDEDDEWQTTAAANGIPIEALLDEDLLSDGSDDNSVAEAIFGDAYDAMFPNGPVHVQHEDDEVEDETYDDDGDSDSTWGL